MESYKAIFLIGVTVCYTFTGLSNVQATSRYISEVPASSPTASHVEPPLSTISAIPSPAPGPTQEDININFQTITNVADLSSKFKHVNNFDFSSMKIDTTAKNLCKGTDYKNECLAAILPDLQKQSGGIEPKDVMKMEAESLFKKANATLEYAKRVMEDGKTTKSVKEAMSVCVENYESMISDMEDARKAMKGGDFDTLETVLSAAITNVGTCSDTFMEGPGVDSPTASLDELMKKLCSNVLAMSQNIHNH